MKECRICKTKASDETIFCSVCGAKLPDTHPMNTSSSTNVRIETPQENNQIDMNKIDTLIDLLRKLTIPKRYEYFMLDISEYREFLLQNHPNVFNVRYTNAPFELKKVYKQYTEEYIKSLGKAGWELIDHDDSGYEGFGYMFKREIIE